MLYPQDYELNLNAKLPNLIKVVGVGGAGGNAVKNMVKLGIHDVDFIACNTDNQVLQSLPEPILRVQIGAELTKGLGAGTIPERGKKAAEESEKAIRELFNPPTEMVFITAGMGGGTGTGAAPVIARIAKEMGRLTVGVVTDPFSFEGSQKISQAAEGIIELKKYCDTVLVIKNDRLAKIYGNLAIELAYSFADDVLANAVKSIAELITRPGIINLDFSDVKTVLGDAGQAVMGSAEASGPNRTEEAVKNALESPLLENNDIGGAQRILVTLAYSDEKPEYSILMSDQSLVTSYIEDKIQSRAQIFKHGFAIDRSLKDKVRITIVAAGFGRNTNEEGEKNEGFQGKPLIETPPAQPTPRPQQTVAPVNNPRREPTYTPPTPTFVSESPQPLNYQPTDFFQITHQMREQIFNLSDYSTLHTPTYKRYNLPAPSAQQGHTGSGEIINLREIYSELIRLKIV